MQDLSVSNQKDILKPHSVSFEERSEQLKQQALLEKKELERAKNSPYRNFIQVNKDSYKAEDWLMAKSPIAYRIFKFLVNNMDEYNAVMCSYRVIQEQFDISPDTVRRAIKLLKEKGYLAVLKSGTSNVYALNDTIVWNSWGTNLKYSKFPANVVLSLSEQEESLQQKIKSIKHKEIKIENQK